VMVILRQGYFPYVCFRLFGNMGEIRMEPRSDGFSCNSLENQSSSGIWRVQPARPPVVGRTRSVNK